MAEDIRGESDGCVDTEIDMGRHLASDRQQTMTSKERREERMERSGSSWREGQIERAAGRVTKTTPKGVGEDKWAYPLRSN